MKREPVILDPSVLAYALGFGVFLGFAGAAAIAPPDPLTQLYAAAALWVLVVPVVYLVLDADEVARHDVRSRIPLPYLVVVTLSSVLAAQYVPLPGTVRPLTAIVIRGLAFLVPFGVVSWLAIQHSHNRHSTSPSAK